MWVRLTIEVFLLIVVVVTATSFWANVRAPNHLRQLLHNTSELQRLVQFRGRDALIRDATQVASALGLHRDNIEVWHACHLWSLRKTAAIAGVAALGAVSSSYFLGNGFLIVNATVALLPVLFDVPAASKNYNATHVYTLLVNLLKWETEDRAACRSFCQRTREKFGDLCNIVAELSGTPQTES